MNETTLNAPSKLKVARKLVVFFLIGALFGSPMIAIGAPPEPVSPDLIPTTLEVWARDVLVGVANVRQLPPAQLVTQENMVFMLAWSKGEDGGVDGNCGAFNPLNTKYMGVEAGGQWACGDETVNYPTYPDGVEAAVYTITGKIKTFQTRMADALSAGLTAEELAHVLATPEEFQFSEEQRQACWACPGGARYEASVAGVIARFKGDPAAYRARADKRLDGAAEFVPLPEEEMIAPKPEFDDSVPVTMTADGAFAFPLRVNAEDIINGIDGGIKRDRAWCKGSERACHHDYPAADITVPTGTMVVAPEAGTIIAAAALSGDRNEYVKIQHNGDACTLLLHMLPGSLMVGVGDTVTTGTPIGRVGTGEDAVAASSGSGTFPHLHFEATNCAGSRAGRQRMDPQAQLKYMFESLPHRGKLVLLPPPHPQQLIAKEPPGLHVSAVCSEQTADGECLGALGVRLAKLANTAPAVTPAAVSPDGALAIAAAAAGNPPALPAVADEQQAETPESDVGHDPPPFHTPPIGWKLYLMFLVIWTIACGALYKRDQRRLAELARTQAVIVL